jgi:hypothetical protein
MDAGYNQLDKIDLHYYERSSRISLKDLTRISATPPEIEEWENREDAKGPKPNFVSDIFYLLAAVNNLSTGPISEYMSALARHVRDLKKQLEIMEKDESWRGVRVFRQVSVVFSPIALTDAGTSPSGSSSEPWKGQSTVRYDRIAQTKACRTKFPSYLPTLRPCTLGC